MPINGPTPKRRFKERFLETFDRSRLQAEGERVRSGRLRSFRMRYATMLLGASLAVTGILPIKAGRVANEDTQGRNGSALTRPVDRDLAADFAVAQRIVREVGSGVTAAGRTLTDPLESQLEKPKDHLSIVTEKVTREFFENEVPFGKLIYHEAKKHDLAPELVAAVVETESRFVPTARSHAGAQGLMQLVPRTGRWMGAKNLMNPTENVRAGTKYLKYLNERFDGNQNKVLAAYNAGEGNVRRFGGIPPFKETRKYVTKVQNAREDYAERVAGKLAESLDGSATDVAVLK
ncbi:MAG TPA: lytic transglycosylase domain-containing protein [Thermoanaerobaculia bacterium]